VGAWLRRKALRDAAIIALLIAPVFVLSSYFGVFDWLYDVTRSHEDWELDEVIPVLIYLGLGALVFSLRRQVDLRHEISCRIAAEDEAYKLAYHDALTGLPNRRQFIEKLHDSASTKGTTLSAVLIVDLDRFKAVNDLYGHRVGDEVLRVIASRLKDIAGNDALIARLGGDEFGIILSLKSDAMAPLISDQEALSRIARRIVYEFPKPIQIAALSVQVGASVGIATSNWLTERGPLASQDGDASETLLRQADMAMYRSKTAGRGMYHFFERAMDEQLQQRVQLEREITSAIKTGQIVPYYQALIDLKSGEVFGFEVLARWLHPIRGLLMPNVLIPIAEDTGTIGEMTDALLRQAVTDSKGWPPHFTLSINLSPRQFADRNLAERIMSILTESGFPPGRLEVEITENVLVEKMDEAKAVLQSLRNVGIRIALDDFGTGYSGLYHLRNFQLDRIKIDRSFVTEMLANPESGKIVEAIVSFSQALGLECTAEGIESSDVSNRLNELGCHSGQGFLFSEPKPNHEVPSYLAQSKENSQQTLRLREVS